MLPFLLNEREARHPGIILSESEFIQQNGWFYAIMVSDTQNSEHNDAYSLWFGAGSIEGGSWKVVPCQARCNIIQKFNVGSIIPNQQFEGATLDRYLWRNKLLEKLKDKIDSQTLQHYINPSSTT